MITATGNEAGLLGRTAGDAATTTTTFSKDLTFARLCDLKVPVEIKV